MSQRTNIHPSLLAAQQQFKKTLRNQPVIANKRKLEHNEASPSSLPSKDRILVNDKIEDQQAVPATQLFKHIYLIVNHLKKEGRPQSLEELKRSIGIDFSFHPSLFGALANNEKIVYKDGKFSYKPIYNVKSKSDLLRLLMQFRDIEGLDSKDIKESYSGASSAIQELKDSKEILTVHNSDCNSEILFYNDQTLITPMDPEFHRLWREILVPDEIDLDKQLRRAGLKGHDATSKEDVIKKAATAAALAADKLLKKKRQTRRPIKLTNVHMKDIIDFSKDFHPPSS